MSNKEFVIVPPYPNKYHHLVRGGPDYSYQFRNRLDQPDPPACSDRDENRILRPLSQYSIPSIAIPELLL